MQQGELLGGRFEIERRAGSGGMGEVFRARDRVLGEAVAVKVLIDRQAPDQGRFAREAEMLADLSHPGIVRYVTHGVAPSGQPYLVMEWLSGEDLGTRLARGRLTLDEAKSVGLRAAHALAAAHACGVVHRDLKPSNLFLLGGEARSVKLLDFGIARRSGVTPMTRTGTVIGTPGYMAPEQVQSGGDVDARADVFALGCVLFECLTGAPPFTGEHFMAILAKILFQEAPRLRDKVPGIPPALDALLARMLAKQREQRPRDGAAVAAALDALSLTSSITDQPPSVLCPSSSALTASERRVVSVVLLGQQARAGGQPGMTLGDAEMACEHEALDQVAESFGGTLALFSSGSAVAMFQRRSRVATDQAAQAARAALALRAVAADRPMVLATGRAEAGQRPAGAAIDQAARLLARFAAAPERVPEPGRARPIGIDDVTAGLLDARFEVVEGPLGFELHGERELAEGTRTLLGKPTACVGRDWELATLDALLHESIDESVARAVLVTAPAGMGKSRLAHELVERVRQRGAVMSIWIGRGDSLRAGSTFSLLRQALRGALGLREGVPLEVQRRILRAKVGEHVARSEVVRVSEFLGELAGAPFPEEESAPLRAARQDAQLMGDQMRKAWIEFIAAESAAGPILLVLEDLHWGDLSTVRFVGAALREARRRPWMVLALARPEVHELFPKLWADRQLQEIRLKELSRRASERLVRQVLGDSLSSTTMDRIVVQAEGHAFYLEELIRAMAEGKGGALPETVLAMVEARLAGLEDEARLVLRAASVFGEVFWQGGVAELLGGEMRSAQASAWLGQLVEQEVLVRRPESRFAGEQEFAFRHAFLREGAYAMLTEEDRALGHQLAGVWLEQRGEGDAMVLAEHFERGKEVARAGSFYLRAAEQAYRGGDLEAVIARARRGLASGACDEVRVGLLGLLSEAYAWRMELNDSATYGEEAMRLSAPGSGPWVMAATAKSGSALYRGNMAEFMATLDVVRGIEPAPEAESGVAFALSAGIFVLGSTGQLELAERNLKRLCVLGERAPRVSITKSWMHVMLGHMAIYVLEDPWAARCAFEAGLLGFEEIGHQRYTRLARVMLSMSLWLLGEHAEAERELSSLLVRDDELGLAAPTRQVCLSQVLAHRGALAEARASAHQLLEYGRVRHFPLEEGRGRWALAEVLRRGGDMDAAEREALDALALLAPSPVDHTSAVATLAAIRLAQGRAVAALDGATRALAAYEEQKTCSFSRGAFVRLVHAEALHAAGDEAWARVAIAAARDHLLQRARRIDDAESRATFLVDVPENARTLSLARAWLGDSPPVAEEAHLGSRSRS